LGQEVRQASGGEAWGNFFPDMLEVIDMSAVTTAQDQTGAVRNDASGKLLHQKI